MTFLVPLWLLVGLCAASVLVASAANRLGQQPKGSIASRTYWLTWRGMSTVKCFPADDDGAVKKRRVCPVLRYAEYLAGHDVDLSMLISVPKVLEDAEAAELEAQRLNDLRTDKGSRYWAVLSRIAVAPAESTAQGPDDFSSRAADLAAAIRLGYEVERDDPNIGFDLPPADEIRWLAGWLVSEGWSRTP